MQTENGIVIPQGSAPLWRAVAELQDNESGPTPILREVLVEMSERLRLVEERLKGYDSLITVLRVTTSKRSAPWRVMRETRGAHRDKLASREEIH